MTSDLILTIVVALLASSIIFLVLMWRSALKNGTLHNIDGSLDRRAIVKYAALAPLQLVGLMFAIWGGFGIVLIIVLAIGATILDALGIIDSPFRALRPD